MRISELNDIQISHLLWRLSKFVSPLEACRIVRHEIHGLVPIFYSVGCSMHSAKIQARKVINFVGTPMSKRMKRTVTVVSVNESPSECRIDYVYRGNGDNDTIVPNGEMAKIMFEQGTPELWEPEFYQLVEEHCHNGMSKYASH